MNTEFFTPTAGPAAHGTETFLIVVAAVVFVVVLSLVLVCLCRTRGTHEVPDLSLSAADQTPAHGSDPIELLIPPLFYTEGLRDPLMQEDLRDRVMRKPGGPSRTV
jgi:hypothetical protein